MSPWFWLAVLGTAWLLSLAVLQRQLRRYRQHIADLHSTHRQRMARDAMEESRVDDLLDAVDEVVFRLDRQGRVLCANRRARKLFRVAPAQAVGQSLIFYYRDPDWNQRFQEQMTKLSQPVHLPDMHVHGRVLAPRLVPFGEHQALLLGLDITERHRLERQRRTFVANLMHDLKTPLTSLLGYARSLESFGHDEAFRHEAVRVIADEARHVNRLLDALLTLDQIEFAERDQDAHCDPVEVVRQVMEALSPQLDAKSLRVELSERLDARHLAMGADDFERIVGNILENAIRHSPENGRIGVELSVSSDKMRLIIEDQGPGVPERELPRLTERFYRVDKGRARKDGGHGLGLAIVKELVDLHQGQLDFSNRKPHGLRVEVELPLQA